VLPSLTALLLLLTAPAASAGYILDQQLKFAGELAGSTSMDSTLVPVLS
jgi:predicted permease